MGHFPPSIENDHEPALQELAATPMSERRWPSFSPQVARKGEAELLIDPGSMDKLHALQTARGKGLEGGGASRMWCPAGYTTEFGTHADLVSSRRVWALCESVRERSTHHTNFA